MCCSHGRGYIICQNGIQGSPNSFWDPVQPTALAHCQIAGCSVSDAQMAGGGINVLLPTAACQTPTIPVNDAYNFDSRGTNPLCYTDTSFTCAAGYKAVLRRASDGTLVNGDLLSTRYDHNDPIHCCARTDVARSSHVLRVLKQSPVARYAADR